MNLVPIVLFVVAIAISVGLYKFKYNAKIASKTTTEDSTDSPEKNAGPSTSENDKPAPRERPSPEDTEMADKESDTQDARPPPKEDPPGSLGATLRSLFRG